MSDNTTAGYYGDALVERLEKLNNQKAARIAELEAAMEFYANSDNYKENYDGLNAPYTNVVKDGGKCAHHALEKKS